MNAHFMNDISECHSNQLMLKHIMLNSMNRANVRQRVEAGLTGIVKPSLNS